MNSRDNQLAAAGRALGRWLIGLCCLAMLAWAVPSVKAAEAEHAKGGEVKEAKAVHGGEVEDAAPAHKAPSFVKQIAYSYLTAFMFFLSLGLGAMFLVLLHHLFDAGWSVPVRRFLEHMMCLLFPTLAALFLPILIMAKTIYPWMSIDPHHDHSLHVKVALFNQTSFYVVSIALFLIWGWLAHGLRRASLAQDKTGDPECTRTMRKYAAGGIFIFAFSLTLAAIYWMKSLQHQFFSTMYGVYYFAGSVWLTLATAYVLTLYFKRKGPLAKVAHRQQFFDLGVIFFAFTVFYAYIHFSQYFLIWNAAVPEETFWYVLREKGSWWYVCMLIIFGHFFLPFLTLLRIDAKLNYSIMLPMAAWAWLMHYLDMQFNVMPVIYPDGVHITIWDPVCLGIIGTVMWKMFNVYFYAHPPYPQKDPRMAEAMGVYVAPASSHAASHGGAK